MVMVDVMLVMVMVDGRPLVMMMLDGMLCAMVDGVQEMVSNGKVINTHCYEFKNSVFSRS